MFSLIIIEHAYTTHNTYHTTYAKRSTRHTAHISYTHDTYMLPLSPPIGFHASLLSGCRAKVQSPVALLPTSTAHARQCSYSPYDLRADEVDTGTRSLSFFPGCPDDLPDKLGRV